MLRRVPSSGRHRVSTAGRSLGPTGCAALAAYSPAAFRNRVRVANRCRLQSEPCRSSIEGHPESGAIPRFRVPRDDAYASTWPVGRAQFPRRFGEASARPPGGSDRAAPWRDFPDDAAGSTSTRPLPVVHTTCRRSANGMHWPGDRTVPRPVGIGCPLPGAWQSRLCSCVCATSVAPHRSAQV
jgi:hypothetical protein